MFVLVALPIIAYTLQNRSFNYITNLPWLLGAFIFILITVPWFILIEIDHPGSIRYYFWNENILRYLTPNYGDRYGDGHKKPYGTIVLFYLLANVVPIGLSTWILRDRLAKLIIPNSPWLAFLIMWTLGPVIFFLVSRNILPSYVLPGCAGTSILLSLLIAEINPLQEEYRLKMFATYSGYISALYLIVTLAAGFPLSYHDSAETIMQKVTQNYPAQSPQPGTIGVWGTNNLSPLWLSIAWENEIGNSVTVKFLSPHEKLNDEQEKLIMDVLVRQGHDGTETFSRANSDFQLREKFGRWLWFRRITPIELA